MSEKTDILIDGKTGEISYARSIPYKDCVGYWRTGRVPPDNETRKALEIGRKVLKELEKHPGRKLRTGNMVGSRKHHITIYTSKKALKGLAWLKSLPVGTRILSPQSNTKVVIIDGGFCIISAWQLVAWEDIGSHWDEACPETCPEWEMEHA